MRIKVDFENENTKGLLKFISETQEGKFTTKKPELSQVTFRRLEIQEQDRSAFTDDVPEDQLLFGISY